MDHGPTVHVLLYYKVDQSKKRAAEFLGCIGGIYGSGEVLPKRAA